MKHILTLAFIAIACFGPQVHATPQDQAISTIADGINVKVVVPATATKIAPNVFAIQHCGVMETSTLSVQSPGSPIEVGIHIQQRALVESSHSVGLDSAFVGASPSAFKLWAPDDPVGKHSAVHVWTPAHPAVP
ncbi:MAG: hypothetical protein K9M11_03390 [Candidatus Pacebacteria bacterium]|nr:hypothetical protein [Candidatus Paceibacterota bacterium]